jgi:cardiolipin synthase
MPRSTRIVATLGPACSEPGVLRRMLAAGVDVVRLNFSHGTAEDHMKRAELVRAAKRGVSVVVVTPGPLNNHPVARLASRRRYGELLAAGVEIHEYQPAMIHAKALVVDGEWTVLGSTNFDNRSFGLNDEVNAALRDGALAARMEEDFASDLAKSRRISLDEWTRRSLVERVLATLCMALERQE